METHLLAGPPPANPPLPAALLIVLLSLTAPFLFLRAGAPSWWLTCAIILLAPAGILSLAGAIKAQTNRRADRAIRVRATISTAGITFLPAPPHPNARFFPAEQIEHAQLFNSTLILKTCQTHPAPGRHILRFGRLVSSRADLEAALSLVGNIPNPAQSQT